MAEVPAEGDVGLGDLAFADEMPTDAGGQRGLARRPGVEAAVGKLSLPHCLQGEDAGFRTGVAAGQPVDRGARGRGDIVPDVLAGRDFQEDLGGQCDRAFQDGEDRLQSALVADEELPRGAGAGAPASSTPSLKSSARPPADIRQAWATTERSRPLPQCSAAPSQPGAP